MPRVSVCFSISQEAAKKLEYAHKEKGLGKSWIIDYLVKKYAGHTQLLIDAYEKDVVKKIEEQATETYTDKMGKINPELHRLNKK